FLNNVKIKNSTLALKKQLFTLIDKNLNLLIKNLNTAELNNFLKEYLSFLKYEKNEEILQQSFRNLNGIFGNKNFTAYDLGFSIQNNDEPF
ncbi:DNA primase, partial [Campylobacter jejuni]|nr:DNA primase [Campylobacter jejuni]EAI0711148.1 DNA primase [Campylobacter jejuni]EAI1795627.1 DNA primase [Campylobacter jejuni]EAI9204858.1 DNA primase [Campylobacter jejuni]EAJ5880438.1 DNA primase [Campylobacter jejuni]